jgi:hypothetical protein
MELGSSVMTRFNHLNKIIIQLKDSLVLQNRAPAQGEEFFVCWSRGYGQPGVNRQWMAANLNILSMSPLFLLPTIFINKLNTILFHSSYCFCSLRPLSNCLWVMQQFWLPLFFFFRVASSATTHNDLVGLADWSDWFDWSIQVFSYLFSVVLEFKHCVLLVKQAKSTKIHLQE